jgi:suppressor of G2 allele of SKP1
LAEFEAEEEKEEKSLDQVFEALYSKSDDNTRRAMLKSYQESKGTVLSTDWSKVGSKSVLPYEEGTELGEELDADKRLERIQSLRGSR